MKFNKIIIVSMILLAIMLMGVASATEDLNTTAQDAVVGTGELELSSPIVDEIDAGGDISLDDGSSADEADISDTAISTDVKQEKLCVSNEDALGDDYEILTPESFHERGFDTGTVSIGNYKMEGTFDANDNFPSFIIFDEGCVIDANEAQFIDIGIILQGGVQISGLTLTSSQYLEDTENGMSPGAIVYVTGDDNILDGLTINYAPTPDGDAYGVYVNDANNFKLLNSNITFTGSSLENYYEYAMRMETCEEALIQGNTIIANLPIINVDYNNGDPGLATDLVLNTGLKEVTNSNIINNTFIANVVDRNGDYPTLDCVMMEYCGEVNVVNNKFREEDFITEEGNANYLNVLDMYYSDNVLVQGNNISVETTGGSVNAGTSYPIQLTGPYEGVVIDGNNLYAHCGGPALGIFSQNYYGDTEITVQNNNIDVTGLPTDHSWGLVSGIELQDNVARVYNNNITTKSVTGSFEEGMNLYGISYAQALNENHNYDIRGNTIETEGRYAIYLLKAQNTTIADNYLRSCAGEGDDTVYIQDASGNTVIEDNHGTEEVTPANVVTQDNFYEFFNDEGNLLDSVEFNELIFKGEFEGLVNRIVLVRPLTIKGDEATLNNMGFTIEGDDCTLDNLKFVADTNLGALILVDGAYDTTLSNLDITYDGGNEEAIAIEVEGDGVKILNNTIFFESHVQDDEVFAIGLKITGSTNALVDGNNITTKLPCVYCNNYDEDYYMMGSDKVNPVRLKNCNNLIFTNNNINSTTNDYSADFPTIQSIQIIGCYNSILDHNNISMIDEMTPAGMDNYLYGINFGYNTNVTFSNNYFNMSTRGGKDAAGTAYAFQGVESEVIIKGNSITSVSNGPNLGIYVASMFGGDSDLIITDNFINVTGSASSTGSWALVSGIEIQNGDAKIYNNTIYTYNVNEYDEYAYMYGISYAQWMYGDRSFDIQDNTVYTEGKYTISVIDATSFNAERNVLVAHNLSGDDSINPGSCADVTIEDNTDGSNTEYTGIIYVSETGDDNNEGSIDYPVATIAHAVQIAAARDNKTSTVYLFNGDYTTEAIDIDDDLGVSLSIIGEEKGKVTIHGTGNYTFNVYGDNLVWNFKNLDFVDVDSTARTSAGLVLYSKNGNFTVEDCSFRNINTKLGAIAIGNDNGNTNVTNCIIEDITGSASSTSILTVNGDGKFILDNVEIRNCKLDESFANSSPTSYLRTIFYVNTYEADVTISNSTISGNIGPAMSLIESRSKLTIVNTTIANNVINTSANGANGGDNLIWANNDDCDINISNSIIANNTIVKSGKGLFFNQKGSINVEYCDISNNDVGSFVGSTGTITANNNWWGTNDRPDSKVDNWVIMNVEVDDSDLTENNKVTLTVDFNHVKTSSGTVEELTGGEIPKDSYSIDLSAQNGEITPSAIVVQKGEVKTETFTVTNVNDVITLNCDGDIVEITIEGIAPYRGIIYVNKTGDDNNEGSIDAPVASLTKAIELANDGIGQIIIDEGTYTGFGYQVTKDLNITGVGKVTLDANNQGGLFATGYPTNANMLILTNLNLAGANADYGQVINSYANELVLNNVNITDNPGSGSLIIQSGKLTVDNCIIANHNGGAVISDSSSAQIIIKNTLFENNTVIDNAVCYLSGYSGDLIIENTQFINNTGKLGIVKSNKKINVKDSKFIDNTNTNSYGGAISDCDEFTITNSAFINNKAAKDGGAIYIGYNRDAVITKSTFIDNVANTQGGNNHGDAIYNHGKLLINYCVLLSNAGNSVIYSESEQDVNAQLNWWGTNDDPSSLNGVGTYEDDDYNEVDCVIDSSNWVYMNVTTNMTGDSLNVGDKVEITVDFTNYIDSTNTLRPLLDRLPEITVSAGKVSRSLDADEVTTVDGIAKFVYTADEAGEYAIRVASGDAVVEIPITVEEAADEIVYVDGANGLDTNDGKTRETAVKTIEHAVEIANGKIIILTGEYTVGSLLNITKDLDIAGEGDVTVKSNVAQTVTYEEWDDWDEEWVTKTKTVYTLIENNANLNLSNIKFTLVPASINMEMITNNANLFINTCEFTNIKVTSSKGVIQNIKTAKLEVNGTTFTASSSTYGAINSNGELLVNNSKFADADRSGEGTVYSTAITAYNRATIVNSEFKNNKGGAGGAVYVMYSYTNKENPVVEINNCIFEDNEATGTYGDGAAIKCSGNQVTLTVTNSTFNNNVAVRNGGAIYAQGTVNVDQCVFTENVAATANTLYAYSGTIDISNSIILDDATAIERYESSYSEPAVVTANDNWWGTNDKPNDYAETWVKMDASFDPANAQAGDEVTVTATFDNDKLPSGVIDVTFTSTSGNLNQVVTVENAKASVTYTIDANDADITATSGSASVVMPIQSPVPAGTIYVSYENGVDTNDGLSEASAVKTIAHAIELADAGIGKIILLEGTHVIDAMLEPTKDLDIKGQGVAIIDGNQNRIIQTGANLNLTNIQFTNGYSSSSNLINMMSGSATCLSLDNVKFYANIAKYGVAAQTGTRLIINNSEFYDNDFTTASNSNGLIYINSADAIIENTVFDNNKGKSAAAIGISRASSASTGSLRMNNVTVSNNLAHVGNGIVSITGTNTVVEITNSKFLNNLVNASSNNVGGNGGAIYMAAGQGTLTVNQSVFINNTGNNHNSYDTGIHANKGTVDITNCILLGNATTENCVVNGDAATITAENNWWGNNDQANTNAVVNKIVTMTATLNPENARIGDEATITVSFDNENLPKGVINVSFTSSSGLLNEAVTMDGAEASVVYTIDENDLSITVKSSQAEIVFPFDPEAGIIFVLPGADDTNPGTRDAPVGTIAHAIDLALAENGLGKIVLLEGVHKTGDLGIISNDLNITGEGNAVIDAQNNNRILYVGEDAKVVISNVVMINGYTVDESGALLGSSNELTLINCTLANSSAGENNGGAIFSVGKLTIINTTIANCTAVRGGAIYTQTEKENTRVDIFNSIFENNIAKGKETWGGGAIYAQRVGAIYEFTLTIDNTTFKNNEAQGTSCGGAIQIEQLASTVKITNSEFISNHANGKEEYGGGAIYTSSPSGYDRQGTMTITGTLFEDNTCDADGGAIYARTTTVKVESSVLINNTDANGLAVYGYKTEQTTPAITLNDNWWGTNDSPKDLAGGNGYKPVLNRWAILTAENASEIREGETVQLTVSINSYTDGTANGTLSKAITVKRPVTISTNFGDIEGVLENGEFVYDLAVPTGLKYIAANVDGETVILYVVTTNVTVAIDDIDAKKFEKVEVTVNVATDDGSEINVGNVELYIGDDLIATIPVSANKAVKEIVFTQDEGRYNLTAKYVDESNLFGANQTNATLTIAGIVELTNETFFNFFDENGLLRDEIDVDELVFHGEFSNLGVDVITIPKSLSLSGDNAVLYDMAISLEADNSKVSDIKLIADGTDFTMNRGAAILAVGENIELNNVSINYVAPRTADAYAVYAYEATGFKLIDSTIAFDSDNAGAIHHAVHISDSDDINVSGNTINASLPARDINWHLTEPFFNSIDQDTVLAIGIQGGSNGVLTENEVNVKTKSAAGMAPTIDSIIVYGVNDFEISWNNITHLDTVNAGQAGYSNAIDLYAFDGVTVKYNNVLVNSTAGVGAKGTAYPIQATGPYSGLVIEYNNLTSISNGPALGIYSQNYNGITDIVITNNNINATGNAAENVNALVSGMELQDTNAKVYNNTIYSQSKGSYDDFNALYGISYSQYTEGNHTFDIKDNNIITEGKFAVYLLKAKNSNVTGNTLYAHELMGDKAVNVSSGEGNIVKDNGPVDSTLTIEVKDITVGETAVINIKLESDIDGIANVIVDGKEYAVNITRGIGQVNVTDLAASDYTVSAKFISSDTNYGGGENSTVFTVAKLESDVNITISDAVFGDNATITVSIPGATGNVTVIVNGKEEEIPLDENGNATYTIDDIAAGDYNVVAIYPGDKDHGFAYAKETFTVDKLASEVNITVAPAKAGSKSIISVNVTDGATGTVLIDVNGTIYAIDLADSKELEVALDAGSYSVVAKYAGDDKYDAGVSGEKTLVVEDKLPANIVIDVPDDVKVGETITINITADTDAKLAVTINGENIPLTDGPNGASSNNILKADNAIQLTYKVAQAGIYNITVSAGETQNYTAQTVTKVFEATKKDAEITIGEITADIGDTVTINATTESDGALTIKVNGETVTGEYPITKAGTYTVVVESAATETYNAGFATYTFEVAEPTEQNITVIVDGKEYNATLVNGTATVDTDMDDLIDNLTEALADANDKVANLTDELANATDKIDELSADLADAQANATKLADELADALANATKLAGDLADAQANVTKLADELANATDKVADLTGELADANDKVANLTDALADANKTIDDLTRQLEEALANWTKTVVVDGKEYPIVYVNGTATVTTEPVKQIGTVIESEYKFTRQANDWDAGERGALFYAVLKDINGNPLANMSCLVAVNGPIYNVTTDDQGRFGVQINLARANTYTYALSFLGNDKYSASFNSTKLILTAKKTSITASAKTFKAKATKTISVTLKTVKNPYNGKTYLNKGKKITLKINGKTYTAKTNAKGVAKFTIKLTKKGKYAATIKFAGDKTYKASSKKIKVIIK